MSIKSLLGAMILCCAATFAQGQILGIATNTQGSLYYSVGAAIAGVVQQKAGLPARVQPMSGPSVYAPIMNRGEVEFGIMNSLDVSNSFNGVENYKGRKSADLRLVGVLFSIADGMGVPNDSPAKSIKDLKGMRIPTQFTAQSTIVILQDALLATAGLSHNDMKSFPVPDSIKGMLALGDGKVDTAMVALGQGASQEAHVALSSHGGLRILPVADSPEAVAAMRKVLPSAFLRVFNPGPGYPGLVAPTALMTISAFLVTSKHIPDEVIYKVTKALYENKVALEATSPAMKSFEPKLMAESSDVGYHPGAEKFYREVGEWPPKRR